jgi:UDP-N-acetylglucosamine 2-epimerase (non-hydrolysing)
MHVVGARPNFMKVAPVINALGQRSNISQSLIHTGQHYDANMSDIFFQQIGISKPDINLEVGSATHAVQTAEIMVRFEGAVMTGKPDLVLVYGDVNSTVAAALVCAKLQIPVGHVEAGLRSFDRQMPEEINRLLTDQISDVLFTPSSDANDNLMREGVGAEKIQLVGNVMIDTLIRLLPIAEQLNTMPDLALTPGKFCLVTLHRPSNVDDPEVLTMIMGVFSEISHQIPVVFPVHPRTRQRLTALKLITDDPNIRLLEPMGYLDFLALQRHAALVITDSGGIQEETTFLGVPCLTVRNTTERPVTVELGTNMLVGRDMGLLRQECRNAIAGHVKPHQIPPLWDGRAAERIAVILTDKYF